MAHLPADLETFNVEAGSFDSAFEPSVDSNGESSSSQFPYQSTQNSLSDSSARRTNPKLKRRTEDWQAIYQDNVIQEHLRSIMSSSSPTHALKPLQYHFCVGDENGSKFSIISDTVPYLLGSDAYLEGLQEIHRLSISDALLGNLIARENVELATLGDKDKAILIIAALADCDTTEETSRLLRNFASVKRQISFWKDTGSNRPKKTLMNFQKLCRLIKDWQEAFPQDDPRLSARWRSVLAELWDHNIDFDYVPAVTFAALLDAAPGTLPDLIQQAQDAARTSSLVDNKARVRALGLDDSFSYHAPEPSNPFALYATRFSHPAGHGTNIAVAETKEPTARQKKAKDCMAQTRTVVKWTVSVTLGVGILAALVIVCFFKIGQKPKGWTQQQ